MKVVIMHALIYKMWTMVASDILQQTKYTVFWLRSGYALAVIEQELLIC